MARTVIIGAGLAGLCAAYHAEKEKVDYAVFEAEAVVGGCCRTVNRDGFFFDYSGHLLHLKDPYFQELVKSLLPGNINVLTRNAVIHSHGVFTRYPFQANLYGLPPAVIRECLQEFVKAYYGSEDLPTRDYKTFRQWIENKLGHGIGKHFMFPYNEKLWTVPTEEMTCDWLSEYVPKPKLEDVFAGAFADESTAFGYNATFWYPRQGGIQSLCDAFAAKLPTIHLNERVTAIHPAERTVTFASGRSETYSRLISTMPLNKLVGLLVGKVPEIVTKAAALLRHNSVLIVNLGVKGGDITDRHWIYLPERRFTPYRIGVYSNFAAGMAPAGTTSYYVEIAYQQGWEVDKEALVERAIADLLELGLLRQPADILVQDVVDLECAYVIYDNNHAQSRGAILDYLEGQGIASIGRYGNWEYSGMEEAMTQGILALERS